MVKYQFAHNLVGRFISEFGMEAYPHLETVCSVITKPEQRYPGSMTMDFHNKAIGHERRLMSYISENFQVKYDLASFIHLSQMVQAEAMAYSFKAWRRKWGKVGGRECGGILVWQLNDCWPTMSWALVVSSIDFLSLGLYLESRNTDYIRTTTTSRSPRTIQLRGL
jgi:beta-mannosidase